MKKFLAFTLACLIAFSLAACGQSSSTADSTAPSGSEATSAGGEVQHVVLWHSLSGAPGDELLAIVDEYNAGQDAEKGIEVEAVYQGYDGTDKQILAYQTNDTENACDINVGLTSTIPSMLSLDWTTKVSDVMSEGDSITQEMFYPAMVRSVSYGGDMVAVPFLNSTMLLYYNVDALKEAGFDRAPEIFEEVAAYTEALTQKAADGTVTRYGFECQVKRYQLVNWVVSQSGDAFFGDMEGGRAGAMTKLTCDEDGTLKTFLEQLDAVNATGGYQYTENNVAEEFAAGTTAMACFSSSKSGSVSELVGDSFEWATAPIPMVTADDSSNSALGGSCLVLFNRGDDARVQAAWDFMQS